MPYLRSMKAITFTSDSERKLNLLVKVAQEMGIKAKPLREITDEEMGIPGTKVNRQQLDEWLSKDNGESFELTEGFKIMKRNLARKLKKKNGSRN
jgi:hypothetical protein